MQEERKLVTFRNIDKITPHSNADRLEIAHIGGWKVVVGKGEFKAGQSVVYFEVDSLIPVTEEFEFLRKYCYTKKTWLETLIPNGEGFRIKTLKLRGELSQGLVIPISDSLRIALYEMDVTDTSDLTNYFGVVKYEVPVNVIAGPEGKKSNFPEFIVKTKQERIQNVSEQELVEAFQNREFFEKTRKYDGESVTIYACLDKGEKSIFRQITEYFKNLVGVDSPPTYKVGVCSHNIEIDIRVKDNRFVKIAQDTNGFQALKDLCVDFNMQLALQGELCGPGIRGNRHGFDELTLVIFDIYDITAQAYILPSERRSLIQALIEVYGFKGTYARMEFACGPLVSPSRDIILKLSEFKLHTGKQNEGIVYKSETRDFSFKAISNEYLLEED